MTREVCEHFNPVDQPCAKCEEKRKSEALFLADELEIPLGTVIQSEVCRRAAKELRRLHAELERCKQVCAATSEAWREEAALAEPTTCAWHGDEEGAYETSCKHIFQMIDGTPQENDFTHCCFCGKSLVQHPWEDDNDE